MPSEATKPAIAGASEIQLAALARYSAHAKAPGGVNAELRQMYLDDQHDREGGPDKIDWSVVNGRDAARRDRVGQFAEAGRLRAADDYDYAAMIFQHGDEEASYGQAFRYALPISR